MTTTQTNEPDATLPVGEILGKGIRAPFVYWRELLKVSFPILLAAGVMFAPAVVFPLGVPRGENETVPALLVYAIIAVGLVLFVAALVKAAVGAHRIFILGPDSAADFRIFSFGNCDWRFLGWTVLITFCVALVILPLQLLLVTVGAGTLMSGSGITDLGIPLTGLGIGALLLWLVQLYLMSRWAFVFPAAATNFRPQLEIGWSWRLSGHFHWRIFFLLGVTPVAASLLFELVSLLVSVATGGSIWTTAITVTVVMVPLYALVPIIELALLSYSFSWIINWGRRQEATQETDE